MSYPGNPNLEPRIQQRVLTAFGEAARLYRDGLPEEARTILRSILEVDPQFRPGTRLEEAIAAGEKVDLGDLLGAVSASSSLDVQALLAKARECLRLREFAAAHETVNQVLKELPGHQEARRLAADILAAQRTESEAGVFLEQARVGLDAGLLDEARNFLRLAGAKDPEHPGIVDLLSRLGALETDVDSDEGFEFEVLHEVPSTDHLEPIAQEELAPAWEEVLPAPAPNAGRRDESASLDFSGGFEPLAKGGIDIPPAGGFELSDGDELFTDDGPARIEGLLQQGQAEFDRGDFQAAIDTWSRIYLIDAHHPEVERRVEQARRRREEVERQAEHLFYEARDAFDQEQWDEARELCRRVLELQPQHVEAHDLLARIDTPAAPPPPAPPSELDEDDLFKDEFVPAEVSSGAVPVLDRTAVPLPGARGRADSARPATARRHLPTPVLLLVGGILVLLLVGGFVLRGRVFSGGSAAVEQALQEAERLAAGGQLQDAINLLATLDADGELGVVVNQRQLEYRRLLRAQPTPVPPPDVSTMREAWSAGKRLETVRLVREGLARAPSAPELLAMQEEISAYSPLLAGLADAVASNNHENASRLAEQILTAHPNEPEVRRIWVNATFNRSLVLLRRYQVVAAHNLLERLAADTGDDEVRRLLQFAGAYRTRPVDPRFDLFVSNLDFRPLT